MSYTESEYNSQMHRNFTKETTLTQVGIDRVIPVGRGDLLIGGALSHSRGDDKFDDGVRADTRINLTSAYGRLQSQKQSFVDFEMGAGVAESAIKLGNETAKISQPVVMAGIRLGKVIKTPALNITPSIGARHQYIGGEDYTLDNAKTAYDDANVTSYQAGLALEKSIKLDNGLTVKPSVASYYVETPDSKAGLTMNDTYHFEQGFGKHTRHELGVVVSGKAFSANLYATHADGKEMSKTNSVGLQVNFRW